MCFGRLPYLGSDVLAEENEDIDKLRVEISAWTGLDIDQRDRADLPDKLYRFLKTLLAVNPADRPTTDEILQSIKAGASFYEHMHGSGPASPIKERKDSRSWPFTAGTASAEPTPTTLELRRRSSALVPSRHTDHGHSTFSPSPRTQSPNLGDNFSDTTERSNPTSAYHVPRLLPPPQPRRRNWLYGTYQTMSNSKLPFRVKSLLLAFKIGLFQGCSPVAANSWVFFPLVALAMEDFNDAGLVKSLVLLAVHLIVVVVTTWKGTMCQYATT